VTCFPASTCFSISCTPQRHHATTLLSGGRCAMHSHARAQPSAAPHMREIASHRRTFVSTTGEGYEKGRLHYSTHSGFMIVLFFGSGGAEDARLDAVGIAARGRQQAGERREIKAGDRTSAWLGEGGKRRRAPQAAAAAPKTTSSPSCTSCRVPCDLAPGTITDSCGASAARSLRALLPKRMRRPASLVVGATCSCLGFL
jgi:hypothetical protein